MITAFTLSYAAKEAARLYMGFDVFQRMPQPTTVFGDGGHHAEVRARAFLPAPPFTIYLSDTAMASIGTVEQLRDELRSLVIDQMQKRGLWRSPLRNRLLSQWRVQPDLRV